MIPIALSIIFVFPISFIFYALSERVIAKHESRVGKKILLGPFIVQTWVDAWVCLRKRRTFFQWFLFFLQCSVVFIFDFDIDYAIFIYLTVNGFALSQFVPDQNNAAISRIRADHLEVRYSIATAIALLCLFGCFTITQGTSLVQSHGFGAEFIFTVPFQLAGMILFGEAPFHSLESKPSWIESIRFYIWSMLSAKLFLGGGGHFFEFHAKSAALYIGFRIIGVYFPKYHQRDLLRMSIVYFFPVTGLLWLFAVVLSAINAPGTIHV